MKMKNGFTLAEVLITLGIIGVVAAMTLPSLIANYQKERTVAQLKKVYSTIAQGIKLSEVDNGEFQYWPAGEDVTSAIDYFNQYWEPYYQVMKMCDTGSDCGYESNTPWYYLKGSNTDLTVYTNDSRRVLFMLNNGTVILVSHASGSPLVQKYVIYVDLNGATLPNMVGKDVFMFTLADTSLLRAYGYGNTDSSVNSNCSETSSGNYCAEKIMRDGWTIADDYPW